MDFNVKKLLNVGLGLTLRRKGGRTGVSRMSGRSSGFTPPKASFRRRNGKGQHLPRAFESACSLPDAEGCSLIENTSFCGFSAGLRRPNHLATFGEILVSTQFAAIFAELEFAGL